MTIILNQFKMTNINKALKPETLLELESVIQDTLKQIFFTDYLFYDRVSDKYCLSIEFDSKDIEKYLSEKAKTDVLDNL